MTDHDFFAAMAVGIPPLTPPARSSKSPRWPHLQREVLSEAITCR